MITLITGATHCGKTYLAQRLLEKYKVSYLSIDHLKMGLIRSGNTDLTAEDDDSLTGYLWPVVREIIKTAIENEQSLIVEGCYVPFDWRKDFDERYLPSIKFICLAFSDRYIEDHFEDIKAHESDIEVRLDDSCLSPEYLINENHLVIDGYHKAGEEIVLIDTDYESSLKELWGGT